MRWPRLSRPKVSRYERTRNCKENNRLSRSRHSRIEGWGRVQAAACAPRSTGPRGRAEESVGARAFRRRHGHGRGRAPSAGRCPALDWYIADRRQRGLLPVLAIGSASARYRGNRRGDLVIGPAHRSLSGPGIPELAQTLRALIVVAALAAALVSAPSVAVPPISRSPNWAELSPA